MSSPREAVYDVLLTKRRRVIDAARLAALEEEWARYEADNRTADAAYRRTTGEPKQATK